MTTNHTLPLAEARLALNALSNLAKALQRHDMGQTHAGRKIAGLQIEAHVASIERALPPWED